MELAINPMDRIEAMDFLTICRNDLDRLIEQSPPIPDEVILEFEKEFMDMPNLKRPDIAHGLEHTRVFDSSKARINQITSDAAFYLKSKKKMMRDEVLPDLNAIIERKVAEAVAQKKKSALFSPRGTPIEGDWRQLLTVERGRPSGPATVPLAPVPLAPVPLVPEP